MNYEAYFASIRLRKCDRLLKISVKAQFESA